VQNDQARAIARRAGKRCFMERILSLWVRGARGRETSARVEVPS
jgi:hypothetical protein